MLINAHVDVLVSVRQINPYIGDTAIVPAFFWLHALIQGSFPAAVCCGGLLVGALYAAVVGFVQSFIIDRPADSSSHAAYTVLAEVSLQSLQGCGVILSESPTPYDYDVMW